MALRPTETAASVVTATVGTVLETFPPPGAGTGVVRAALDDLGAVVVGCSAELAGEEAPVDAGALDAEVLGAGEVLGEGDPAAVEPAPAAAVGLPATVEPAAVWLAATVEPVLAGAWPADVLVTALPAEVAADVQPASATAAQAASAAAA